MKHNSISKHDMASIGRAFITAVPDPLHSRYMQCMRRWLRKFVPGGRGVQL